ncbi:IclR family transcriptional regulator [Indiicoccus explosivorum]|uniref:IclR family transcriptional regulator n=1 Tax=Indiicoccus explosivorum TaxID=1917864 RepID=UPI000B442167|nr:IclR family transcriptional regulator [Indiicoccus explosivorum]
MQALDRAMLIADILSAGTIEEGLTISELSIASKLPLGTMHRILKAMSEHGMVEQDVLTKRYRLGTVWMEYGLRVYDSMDYISKIRPELERLSKEVNESVYLSKPAGPEAIIMERIDSENNTIRIYDQLGTRIPMHIGAANKAMLAAMPETEAKRILSSLVPAEELRAIQETLARIRRQGYAVSHGERTAGTSSIGVAVTDRLGAIIGAISVGFINYDLSEERFKFLIEQVVETGSRISVRLGSQ